MEPIKILPHHAMRLFEVFYLGQKPEEALSWYNDGTMKQNGIEAVNRIVSNPDQLIQLIDSYDSICRMCPKNRHGNNYAQNPDDTCTTYDNGDVSDRGFAEILGLEGVCNSCAPGNVLLMNEPPYDSNGKKKSLRQMFRVRDEFSYSNSSFFV